jgi:hypothetical protein
MLVLERRSEKGEGRDMDVDIDPNDDKASQGDDAEAPPPKSAGLWNGNTAERPWGTRQGTRAEMI